MNETPEPTPEDMTEETPLITPARPLPSDEKPVEETTEATEATDTPAETEKTDSPVEEKPAAPKKERGGLLLDTLLVLLLGGTLGGGAWYLNRELSQYRVPSPMEIAAKENVELNKQRDALQDRAYHADEQLHLRKRLSALAMRSAELQRSIAEKKQVVETQHQKVLAVQHDIRQEDKNLRTVAKGLLPGMPIGTATTTTGRTYHNAVIRRLEGGRITLRMPEGQTTFPVNQLVKDNLPDLARYAFGQADMVDMSDFESTPDQPKPKARKGKQLITPRAAAQPQADNGPKDYDPASGAPVVDTDANKTSTWTGEGDDAPTTAPTDTWKAPEGELPF